MTCGACDRAQTNPMTGRYHAGCTECAARALAQSADFFSSKTAGQRTKDYQAALTKIFGEGQEDAGHERVKAQAKRIRNHTKGST